MEQSVSGKRASSMRTSAYKDHRLAGLQMKENTISNIKLTILAVAIVVGIPLVSSLAARQLTLEPEYDAMCAHLRAAAPGTSPLLSARRVGGDGVFVSNDTLLTPEGPIRFTAVLPKPD